MLQKDPWELGIGIRVSFRLCIITELTSLITAFGMKGIPRNGGKMWQSKVLDQNDQIIFLEFSSEIT